MNQGRQQQWADDGNGHPPPRPPTEPVILVCDDDPSVRALYALVVTGFGPRVVEAATGEEALRIASNTEIALVVLDSNLPGLNGLQVLRALRERPPTSHVPVVFVTAEGDVGQRVKAFESGAHDYLVKPVHLEELRARVRSHLRRHQDALGEMSRLERLAAAATTLCRARVDGSLEIIAAAACRELASLHEGVEVALHAFVGDGRTACLADHRADGSTTPGGTPLDAEEARQAHQRALAGPWLETEDPTALHRLGAKALIPGRRTAAWVPLATPGEVLGVLVLSAPRADEPLDLTLDAMRTAREFAPSIAALLAPGLEQQNESRQRRARLSQILGSEFFPVFQPIVALQQGQVEGYEALTRFVDGTRPDLRLAEAASLGSLVAFEAALFRTSLRAAPRLPVSSWVSMNVSPGLLLDARRMRGLLSDYGGPPLVLELTEHDRIDDYEAIRKAVDDLGVEIRLSVDDAGAGWSCLKHILDLQPAFIKLDRSWISGVEHDPARQALIAGLSHFSHNTGCQLIAEGIETEVELRSLRELGVSLGQGYHLGRPAPVDGWDVWSETLAAR